MIYSTKQVAELLGYNDDSYIRRLILEGKLKASKFNRQWMVKDKDIEAYKRSLSPSQVKYRSLFQYNEELRGLIDPELNKTLPLRGPKDAVVAMFMTKALKTHGGLLHLCRGGFGEDAAILSRALFEMMISLFYILKDTTDESAYRYFEFDWILQKRMFDSMSGSKGFMEVLKDREKNPKKGDTSLTEINKKAIEAEHRFHYGKSETWSDKSIRDMAKVIGREEAYLTAYRLECQMAHSASRAMINYTQENEGGIVLDIDNPYNWVEESLVTGFDFLFYIVQAFDKQFTLGLENKLNNLEKRYIAEINSINKK